VAETIQVGVVGFGVAGRVFHCPFVAAVPGLTLSTIVQRSGDQAAHAYPSATIVRSVEELLDNPQIDLVCVATPNDSHYEVARKSLEAGKHVVVDKPLARTSQEAQELIELARATRLILAPFQNRRWDGDFLTLKKLLQQQKLGRVISIESHFDRYRPILREGTWKEKESESNGVLFDLGPHLIDQAFALFGPPKTVTATIRRDRDDTLIEDAFDIALQYDRLIYWCRATLLAADPAPRFLAHGTAGSYRKLGVDLQEPVLLAGAKLPRWGEGEWHAEPEDLWGELTLAPKLDEPAKLLKTKVQTELGDYRRFYANVRDAMLGKSELEVKPQDALNVMRTLELARASARQARTLAFN
jgi:scyllo-inositol 2-dehydrogenase (NADP+)